MTRRRRAHAFVAVAAAALCAAAALALPSGAATTRPYFSVARNLWLSEADMVSSALQNVPLVAAASDLGRGLLVHGANIAGYSAAIVTIKAFERIPLTSETPAQVRASHRDWSALNAFFDVTLSEAAVLDNEVPSGAQYDAAVTAWLREPSGVHSGLNVSSLKIAVSMMRAVRSARPQRAILYQAALVDARSLEHADARDIAHSGASLLNPYRQDIFFLNVFFRASRLESTTAPA